MSYGDCLNDADYSTTFPCLRESKLGSFEKKMLQTLGSLAEQTAKTKEKVSWVWLGIVLSISWCASYHKMPCGWATKDYSLVICEDGVCQQRQYTRRKLHACAWRTSHFRHAARILFLATNEGLPYGIREKTYKYNLMDIERHSAEPRREEWLRCQTPWKQ